MGHRNSCPSTSCAKNFIPGPTGICEECPQGSERMCGDKQWYCSGVAASCDTQPPTCAGGVQPVCMGNNMWSCGSNMGANRCSLLMPNCVSGLLPECVCMPGTNDCGWMCSVGQSATETCTGRAPVCDAGARPHCIDGRWVCPKQRHYLTTIIVFAVLAIFVYALARR